MRVRLAGPNALAVAALTALVVVPLAAAGDRGANAEDASARQALGYSGKAGRCLPLTVRVAQGGVARLKLDCKVARRGGGTRSLVREKRKAAVFALVERPRNGVLEGFDKHRGTVRYRPRVGFVGADRVSFRVRLSSGRSHRGKLRILVVRGPGRPATEVPPPSPAPEPQATPVDDGLPPLLPPAPASVAFGARNWSPTPADTCPRALHERFSVIGRDGKVYPGWHPPVVTDPATGESCTFGHEHGRDPSGSQVYDWVAAHFAAEGKGAYAGIPFGSATEALDEWARANPGVATRQEDHVGYKVDFQNDVPLISASGANLGTTCDYIVRFHQGSHSADAFSNNVHELLYAVRCTDGTELISNIVSSFGNAGEYQRSCDPTVSIVTTDNGYPDGGGARLLPDRTCMEEGFLVPAGRTTSAWATYEKWSSENELRTAGPGATALATFNPSFGVFNPSRYGDLTSVTKMRRTLDLCWEVEPNGDLANGVECDEATGAGSIVAPFGFDDDRSPYDGTYRDFYLDETRLDNVGGPTRWWTDPYGGNAAQTPFPGAICQLVGTVDTTARPDLQVRVFGRNRTNDAPGVHAPN